MASNDNWTYVNTVTTGSTTAYPLVFNGSGTWAAPAYYSTGGGGGGGSLAALPAPVPTPRSALEWLDAEIEKTCARAR